jgi:plasmid maintenance system antidote protein VapI
LRERKPASPAVAVRLGKLFGDGAGIWLRMQAAYDTRNAERKEDSYIAGRYVLSRLCAEAALASRLYTQPLI